MALIEKLGSFYLGKEYDLAARSVLERQVHYDSRDLTTHAVCVGMTGSGKTGLCIDLLEEAALDGVPAIIIDPKGDITNLLLTFPELSAEEFRPWINLDDAQRKGMDPDAYAASVAQTWRDGLAQWDQGPERVRALKQAADFALYTPGSTAGLPVSILNSFEAPTLDWEEEEETLRERVTGTVSALLGLVGVNADPLRSREHILLANIVERAWRAGENLDLAKLITAVQRPPFRQLGVLDLDSFFPEKDRFELAMLLNNIVASPSFASWLTGDPLDIGRLLYTEAGKPRHSVFYIAHLSDAERMFFVTMLLEQMISWMRAQPGTSSLRAILYMDEIFGFFPPVAEPPSKRPMLTLLKQARAFGVGCMLTTQNPVDLDYKGLANTGTWFIGKMQTERDKMRVLEGLETIMAEAGAVADPRRLDRLISSLDDRVFLLHNVHEAEPVVFQTRWAMSYLRGPLTRQQIRQLVGSHPDVAVTPAAVTGAPAATLTSEPVVVTPSSAPPALPPDVRQVYLPIGLDSQLAVKEASRRGGASGVAGSAKLRYEPAVLGLASVRFVDIKLAVDHARQYAMLLKPNASPAAPTWSEGWVTSLAPRDLQDSPAAGAIFPSGAPENANTAIKLRALERGFADHLYRSEALTLAFNPTLKLYSRPGEDARDFSIRCQQAAREARDEAVDQLGDRYAAKVEALQERLARAERDLGDERGDLKAREREELASGVETLAGILGIFGRRRSRGVSTAASKRRQTEAARADVHEAEADVARLKAEVEELKEEQAREAEALSRQWEAAAADRQEKRITPRKTDVQVQLVALAWVPVWEVSLDDGRGWRRVELVPAAGAATGA